MIGIDVTDRVKVYAVGRTLLADSLGPEGAALFMEMARGGKGDYTAEKYDLPDMTDEEEAAFLAEAMAEPGAILD